MYLTETSMLLCCSSLVITLYLNVSVLSAGRSFCQHLRAVFHQAKFSACIDKSFCRLMPTPG